MADLLWGYLCERMKKFHKLKMLLSALVCFFLPGFLSRSLLNLLGHRVSADARVGLSWLYCSSINLDKNTRIGHFNYISTKRMMLRESAWIGHANLINGPLDLVLRRGAVIGKRNRILRGRRGVTFGYAQLWLDEWSAITSDHRLDCTKTIRFGQNSFLAGAGSQIWTHGYIHDTQGPGRYRIDGKVEIGNNVYIGSACIISMGIRIASGTIVGAGTVVARDLDEPGLYVSAAIRKLPRPASPDQRADLIRVADDRVCERVYVKSGKH